MIIYKLAQLKLEMNVLGKIKSKKLKTDENSKMTQNISTSQNKYQINSKVEIEENAIFQKQSNSQAANNNNNKNQFMRIVNQEEYIPNTNVISKQKQKALREQYSDLIKTANTSASNNFSSYFHTKKQSKKSGVYFEDNSMRSNSYFSNQVTKQKQKHISNDQSISNQDEFSLDFDFLLSNRQKKQIKKQIHMSKGKIQHTKQIQEQLKLQHNQVLCFFIRKINVYGDVIMFEGELQSLKNRCIEIDTQVGKKKVYDRIKVKISCGKDIIAAPETIGRIYVSQLTFLSENQAMIIHQNLLKTVQKGKRRILKN